jgi:hypothetical protein
MIRPTKYLDLNTSVVRIAAFILKELKVAKTIQINELDEIIRNNLGENSRFNFIASLNFLFLLGKIDYEETSDSLIFTNVEEASI